MADYVICVKSDKVLTQNELAKIVGGIAEDMLHQQDHGTIWQVNTDTTIIWKSERIDTK